MRINAQYLGLHVETSMDFELNSDNSYKNYYKLKFLYFSIS